jgi:amino acid adenylation domain-containing protein
MKIRSLLELQMSSLSELAELSPIKRKLVLQRLKAQAARSEDKGQHAPPLLPAARDAEIPLSYAQQRMWFLAQLEPESPFYNIAKAIHFKGPLDVNALEKSLNHAVERHEALRTTFPFRDGRVVQEIIPAARIALAAGDLTHLPENERLDEALKLVVASGRRAFDLSGELLVRAELFRLNAEEHVLLLMMHHIVSDGWSMGVLVSEVAIAYEAFATGVEPVLPELPIQYADFTLWQKRWLTGEVLAKQLEYWKKQLADVASLALPTDRPRSNDGCFHGNQLKYTLPLELSTSLAEMSRERGVTLFMLLLAAFKVLLHRYTAQTDILVGTPIANRNRAEIEPLIGFFVNTLVLRTSLEGNPTFDDIVGRVKEATLGAYANQDLPFERVVEEINPERAGNNNPLFQVMLALQNTPLPNVQVAGVTFELFKVATDTAKFDLLVEMAEAPDGLFASFEYNTALFDEATIVRIMRHFQGLLESIVAGGGGQRISDLCFMAEPEQRQLIEDWNQTDTDYPARGIHELFAASAARTPDAVAVDFDGTQVTYSELELRANQLAHHLRSLGVGRGTLVATYLDRSVDMIVSMIGILKAGGAYLPLDISYPQHWIDFMLEDAGVHVLLTHRGRHQNLPALTAAVVRLEDDWSTIARCEQRCPVNHAGPHDLAYVIYTSGSTGTPKGVCIPHRGVNRLVFNTNYIEISPSDSIAQASNASFDAATFEIWGALLHGARLVGINKDVALSPPDLAHELNAKQISVIFLTTALFNQIAREAAAAFDTVRVVLFGGELVDPHRVRDVLTTGGPQRLLHVYGPTESTTYSSWYHVNDVPEGATTVPIGGPLSNTKLYVLDQNLQPVPAGVHGELYVGGDGLAHNYHKRPGLTAERFVPDPLSRKPGARLYRTGDVVRWQPDGQIQFIGRSDHQVKVRGFRIELGEIETVLASHPAVSETVVVAREDSTCTKRLAAYVVCNADNASGKASANDLPEDRVSQWGMIFNDIYSQGAPTDDVTFNIAGWTSNYTDKPIPGSEMQEWLDDTVGRILSLKPRRVLEIGCGTGLLLFKIAPQCEFYRGTDVSKSALDYVSSQSSKLHHRTGRTPNVELLQQPAGVVETVEPESFDTVILNSVVQYFPGIDYLVRILEGAVKATAPGGSIFIGDVRSRPLLEAYHTAVELSHAESELPIAELRKRIQTRIRREDELVIDPAFFFALKRHLRRITSVEIQPKRGSAHNELTQFRYQVVIQVGDHSPTTTDFVWHNWQNERLSVAGIKQKLLEEQPDVLGIRGICNARVAAETKLVELLGQDSNSMSTTGELRDMLHTLRDGAIDPNDLWTLSGESEYDVHLSWAQPETDGRFDAVFIGRDAARGKEILASCAPSPATNRSWASFANNPLSANTASRIGPQLRRYLEARLPDYMVPSFFVVMDALPLSRNGKVDRHALPAPEQVRPELDEDFISPRTPVEATLAGIWSDVLALDKIGVHDNFFNLGGHSLLATQVNSRIREALRLELPLRRLFEYPTIAELAASIEQTLDEGQQDQARPILRTSREYLLPLSFAQERLWFLDQLEPGSAFYNTATALRAKGPLNLPVLERTFSEIARRHESLRTVIQVRNGRPVQSIQPARPIAATVTDLSTIAATEREAEARLCCAGQARQPFDLVNGPLFRVHVTRLDEEDHIIVVTMHHIISDGWSLGVLTREVASLYEAFSSGGRSPLSELNIQYADYAVWQREYLEGEVLDEQLRYWGEQLQGLPGALELPADRPRPSKQSYRGETLAFTLPHSLSERLNELSQHHDATLFMTLLAAFQLLLYRYTNQRDILVGTPIANRNREEIENLIGFFVNTLVLRTQIPFDGSFSDLLSRVRESCLGAYAHQDLPFEKLVEELQPERSLSFNPLFQVMFALQNSPMPDPELSGLRLSSEPFDAGVSRFDLELHLRESAEGLSGMVVYSADLFDQTTIARLLAHFENLLEEIVAAPSSHLSDYRILSEPEQRTLLCEWNATKDRQVSPHSCMHEFFEAQARLSPDSVAVTCDSEQLTYSELNARANQLCERLCARGVATEERVGVCVERSVEMIVALLAVLKSGGAYIPLDPEYPRERLAFILRDSAPRVVLTQEQLVELLPEYDCDFVFLASIAESHSVTNPENTVAGENLAYVIYTSGSTGQPKGVCIEHRQAVTLIDWARTQYRAAELSAVLASTSLCFDLSIFELFVTLSAGGTVVLAANALALAEAPGVAQVSLINTVPSAIRELLRLEAVPTSVEIVNLAGEALPAPLVEELYALPQIRAVYNLYGPSEDTTYSTGALMRREAGAKVTIGRALPQKQVHVFGERMELLPVGVTGELYMAGRGLARGYLNAAALTAERFVPHPYSTAPGARLYRTGDLARWLASGEVEFLGRRDQQVKLRGYRIELGEIEAALLTHAGVREAVVIVKEDERGEKRLLAYVVQAEEPVPAAGLTQYLSERLPGYMVPAQVVSVAELPLTANGKVDRQALARLEVARAQESGAEAGARTPVEEVLSGIWSETLGVKEVGLRENFFELGGHSLLATQIVSRVREVFGVELALRTIFEQPTVSGLSRTIELARQRGSQETPVPEIKRLSTDQDFVLSFAQERLWFIEQFDRGNPFYNFPFAVRLTGTLDVEALHRSLNEVVRRHAVLRTSFVEKDGRPIQVISPARELALPIVDFSEFDETQRASSFRQFFQEETAKPFDLSSPPLIRASLIRQSAREHIVVMVMHHIISDGWSLGVLVKETGLLYQAFSQGEPSPLRELPFQYADFAAWQRGYLAAGVLDEQLRYWKEQLQGAPALLELPTDRPRPALQSYRGADETIVIPLEMTTELKQLARRRNVTLFMLLLATFKVLLHRYTGQTDIVVGTPIANRNREETEPLIGFFVNTLVLRTDLAPESEFTQLLARIRDVSLNGYAHQDLPFEKLVEELNPERTLSYSPLFQVLFNLQYKQQFSLEMPDLTLEFVPPESAQAKFDLIQTITETARGLNVNLRYNSDLFNQTTIQRMLEHYQTLLQAITTNPSCPIYELPLLSPAEEHRLLVQWNDTNQTPAPDKRLHDIFEAQVERTPDAPAVLFEDAVVTYDELNRRANRLAHHLRASGIGPEVVVGIMMERSVELVVALLGVLKAGGACLPLDPAYPESRLSFMITQADVPVLLTQKHLAGVIPECNANTVFVEAEWTTYSDQNIESGADCNNTAFVIYTSGSTGQPKGVVLPHRGLVNRMLAGQEFYRFTQSDRFLQKASISFDVSIWEMFWPLLVGAQSVLARPGAHGDAAYLAGVVAQQQVTYMHFVPSMLQVFLQEKGVANCNCLRGVFSGGEALTVPLMEYFFEKLPARLYNQYGPTEISVSGTYHVCRSGEQSVPIGRPFANYQMYALGERMELLPVGVTGELHVGGAGVARGYLNAPALTAERFVPHPYSTAPGARLYRTGDLARWLASGEVEFLGRRDQQVKLRGYRIELGEIEAALLTHAGVREAVVIVKEDERGEKRLLAYVVQAEEPVPAAALTQYLSERLPGYMVPAQVVSVAELPLTANGKVDRQALARLEVTRAQESGAEGGARTPVEEVLSGIWSETLGVKEVGLGQNFFELGGHSLLATQVVSRVREVFGVELALRTIFEQPTVAATAAVVEALLRADQQSAVAPIVAVARPERIPLSFAQERLWFLDQLEPDTAIYNVPVALRLSGPLNLAVLEETLTEIVRRHESLRTSFPQQHGTPYQLIAEPEEVKLVMLDLSGCEDREAQAREIAAAEARQPFALSSGPLFRVRVIQLEAEEHLLMFTMHHIVTDIWSIGVLIREVVALYESFLDFAPSSLPDLDIQYADFVLWQKEWLRGETLDAQVSYWKQQLSGAPALLSLPTDRPRPVVQTFRGATHTWQWSRTLSDKLHDLSRSAGVSLYMTLLAACKTLLYRYSNQTDIVVGTPIANRNRGELEPLIGFFVNTLALRTNVAGSQTFRELLARVRETALGAYLHQELPFEKLVEELSPERSLSYQPIFQVMFIFNNAPLPDFHLPELSIRGLEWSNEVSKFDLTFIMMETGEGLKGFCDYSSNLFDSTTIERMVHHFEMLLESVAGDAEQTLDQLPLLREAGQRQLIVEWNDTRADFSTGKCVHQLFEEQAAKQPDAIALVCDNEQVTYDELNRRANQLAHHLRDLGVGPEVLVGLLMERSIEWATGLLAIHKAGGAHVSLDPTYPKDRLFYMMQDARSPVLLTQRRFATDEVRSEITTVCIDADRQVYERLSEQNPDSGVSAKNAAYVVYTSGSTGRPKGVVNTHGSLVNLSLWHQRTFSVTAADRASQIARTGFDASVWELWPYLISGASLHFVDEETRLSSNKVKSWFIEKGITIAWLPPVLAEVLLLDEDLSELSLRVLTAGSDKLLLHPSDRAGFKYFNTYGPTEATVISTCGLVPPQAGEGGAPSIGHPIANTQIYILDQLLQPVPIGVRGELFIAGDSLARGYLKRPELTAEKFIPNPFGETAGRRLYRTGDLARYQPDGSIEFSGRNDAQVKIHGFRIELGEIEARLSQHPCIESAVVVVHEQPGIGKRLVGYVVEDRDREVSVTAVREYLRQSLPDYMVPAIFVKMDSLPLSPNGKVDRRALPVPDRISITDETDYEPPRTSVEEELVEVWLDLLKLDRVGIGQNFFELGGHSLLATRLASRIEEKFHVQLPLRELFESPTIAGLAAAIERVREAQGTFESIRIQPIPRGEKTLDELIAELDSLSESEVRAILSREMQGQV